MKMSNPSLNIVPIDKMTYVCLEKLGIYYNRENYYTFNILLLEGP